jgi:thiol-disulfide isomerase/thioredoxin
MRNLWLGFVVAIGVAAAAGALGGPKLNVGDPAPAIKVGKWVKGQPVTKIESGKVYVIEFWATWCGPCRSSIPHLTELAKKYEGKVTFAGISVWEHGDVAKFVKEMGAKMVYSVATDSSDQYMAKQWMEAAGENGIPCAFVVGKDRKIVWIGHPMGGLEETLDQVLAGKFDVKAFAKQRAEEKAREKKRDQLQTDIETLIGQDKPKEALAKLDKYIAEDPSFETDCIPTRLQLLLMTDEKAGSDYAKKLADGQFKDEPYALIMLAYLLVDKENKVKSPDYDLALSIAGRALELSKEKDAYVLARVSEIYEGKGDFAKAVQYQEKALKAAEVDKQVPPEAIDMLKTRLRELKNKSK